MDVIKSKMTRTSRASDITLPQITFINDIMIGTVYHSATVLTDRMEKFDITVLDIFHATSCHQLVYGSNPSSSSNRRL